MARYRAMSCARYLQPRGFRQDRAKRFGALMQSTAERLLAAKTCFYQHLAPQLQRVRQGATDLVNVELGKHGVTVNQAELLAAAFLLEDTDQQGVARALGIDASSTMALVDKLEAAEMLRREISLDRRRRLIRLTEKGAKLVEECVPAFLAAGEA